MSWDIGKVSDIADIISGYAFKSTWFGVGESKVVRIGDLQQQRISSDNIAIFDSNTNNVPKRYRVKSGDILMALSGATVGKIAIAQEKDEGLYLNQRVSIIRGKNEENSNYLKFVFSGQLLRKLLTSAGGAAQPNLSPKSLAAMEIPLPPLPEQKRIAAILDKADAIRRKRQQAIDLADEFLRSVFLELFGDPVRNPKGWDECTLNEVALIRSGVTKGRKLKNKKTVVTPYMRVANVQDGHIALDSIQEIEVLETDVEKYLLKFGDLLLTEGGDPDKLGRGAVWKNEIKNCIHQNHIFCVRANSEILHSEFLSTQISSIRGKRYFLKYGKQTTGIASINKTVLSGYPVLIPPLDKQLKFVSIKEKIEAYLYKVNTSSNEINNQFNSLSQQAFAGKL